MKLQTGPKEWIKSIVLICLALLGRESISWQRTGWNPNVSSLRSRTSSNNTNPNIASQVHQLESTYVYDHPEPVCSTILRSKLRPGELLYSDDGGHFICSPNGKTWFGYDDEGDLSLWRDRRKVWSAETAGMDTITTMQHDGNLVVYRGDYSGGFPPSSDMALWSSNTGGRRRSYLSIEDDGHARIWFGESMIWSAVQTSKEMSQNVSRVEKRGVNASAAATAPSRGGGPPTGLDFAVIGFPKTGTSFLWDVLGMHPEVVMAPGEFCRIHREDGVKQTLDLLRSMSSLPSRGNGGATRRYGIKCPDIVRETDAINNLGKMTLDTRLVVGVRHPVLWFESFYNFRVQNHYDPDYNSLNEKIPTPFQLVNGTKDWRDVSTAYASFDVYLKQLAKVNIEPNELKEMINSEQLWPKRISVNSFRIFLYTVEQLHDNDMRQSQFREDLQEFLRLEAPLVNFNDVPKRNALHSAHPEQIDICEHKYSGLRSELVQRGRRASEWILEKFIGSSDVVVSGREQFSSILREWGEDPCRADRRFA